MKICGINYIYIYCIYIYIVHIKRDNDRDCRITWTGWKAIDCHILYQTETASTQVQTTACADSSDIGKDITLRGEGQKEKEEEKKTVTASQKCPSFPLFLKSVACKCIKAPMSEKYFSLFLWYIIFLFHGGKMYSYKYIDPHLCQSEVYTRNRTFIRTCTGLILILEWHNVVGRHVVRFHTNAA